MAADSLSVPPSPRPARKNTPVPGPGCREWIGRVGLLAGGRGYQLVGA